MINACYEEIVKFRKNIFLLPSSGKAGKHFVSEMTRLVEHWNNKSDGLSEISVKALMCMPALLLQKPHYQSTAKEHADTLARRLVLWKDGISTN